VNNFAPRSTFQHQKMLTDARRSNYMTSTSTTGFLKTVGMKDDTGFTLMVMNTNETIQYPFIIQLNMGIAYTSTNLIKADAGIDLIYAETIPANTTITYVFDNQGIPLKRVTYNKSDADNFRDPVVTTGGFTNTETITSHHVTLYPTLTEGLLYIQGDVTNHQGLYKIYDTSGKLCLSGQLSDSPVNVKTMQNGLYLLRIETNHGTITKRFIKQ
jgi:hypothetical protein